MYKFILLIIFHLTMSAQNNLYDISIKSINNEAINLGNFKGKNILFVNVASYCGYTKQYAELQELYEKYDDLEVIGIPCNQFLFQEPKSQEEIMQFCSNNYGVTFIMTEKIKVKGKDKHELYKWLTNKDLNNNSNSTVKWNFQKYLINKDGQLIDHFQPSLSPLSEEITQYLD